MKITEKNAKTFVQMFALTSHSMKTNYFNCSSEDDQFMVFHSLNQSDWVGPKPKPKAKTRYQALKSLDGYEFGNQNEQKKKCCKRDLVTKTYAVRLCANIC